MATKAKTRRTPGKAPAKSPVKSPTTSPAPGNPSGAANKKVEWVAAALSACLFTALVIYLAVLGFSKNPDFADFEVRQSQPYNRGGATHIDVAVRNTGSKTAADVLVIARLDGEQVSEIVFDHVPSGSTRQGTIRLTGDIAQTRLDIAVAAYRDP